MRRPVADATAPSQSISGRSSLAVSLHRKSQPVPTGKRRIGEKRLQQLERQIEAVCLLGVDGEREPGVPHGPGELFEARQKLGAEAGSLRRPITRMQCRELDRESGARDENLFASRRGSAGRGRDRLGRELIASRVALGVPARARRLPQHIEGEAITLRRFVLSVDERFVDGLAEHELTAKDTHRLAERRTDQRLSASCDQALKHAGHIGFFPFAPIEEASGQHQAPGRGVDQERVGASEMARPVAGADGLGDQPVHGFAIGDAQQCLGEAEQQHPLFAREPILMKEGVDPAGCLSALTRRLDQVRGQGLDAAPLLPAEPGPRNQVLDQRAFVDEKRIANGRARWKASARPDMAVRLCHEPNLALGVAAFEMAVAREAQIPSLGPTVFV